MYAFLEILGEGRGFNRGKSVIGLSTGEVPAPPETGNDILIDSDILLDSYVKIRMHYVVSGPDPDVGNVTQ